MVRTVQLTIAALLVMLIAQPSIADEMQSLLFKEVDESLRLANEAKANLLAPTSYSKGSDYYRSAQQKFTKQSRIQSINKDLNAAKKHFTRALAAANQADIVLLQAIQARNGAEAANADQHTPQQWQTAEVRFSEAAQKLEQGNKKSALKIASDAESLFEQAELNAIKNHYLNTARDMVAKAKKAKASKYAPLTLNNAIQSLDQAERTLEQDRYDLDRPRALAKDALYQAAHAIKITSTARAVAEREQTVEQLILNLEAPLQHIGDTLDIKLAFDGSTAQPIAPVQTAIKLLQKDAAELIERNAQMVTLESQLSDLENRLGLQSDRLRKQEEREQKIAVVEGLFADHEAIVLTKGDSVIVRMIGLNFKSGQATIDRNYFPLLRKVMTAIGTFTKPSITVEGHTDSFGGDEVNLELSAERAIAVQTYLMANIAQGDINRIVAQGYGESKPIANNESAEGRQKNRRIDLVITE